MARIEYDIKFRDGFSIGAECAIEDLFIGTRHMSGRVIDSVSVTVTGASTNQDFQMVSDFFEVIKTHQRRCAIEPLPGHPGYDRPNTILSDEVHAKLEGAAADQADMQRLLTKGPMMPMQMTKQELDQNPWPLWEQGKPVFPIALMYNGWARKLHWQGLHQLAERGGMTPREVLTNVERMLWSTNDGMDLEEVMGSLKKIITDYYNRIK